MKSTSALLGQVGAGGSDVAFRAFPRRGDVRWLLEEGSRRPWHLETWPRCTSRARIVYRVARALGSVGLMLPSRRVVLACAPDAPYAALRREFDRLGVFVGTPGITRKLVVFAENAERSVFVKIPAGPAAAARVANEERALQRLAANPELLPLVPSVHRVAGHLAVENLCRRGARYGELALDPLVAMHERMFGATRTNREIGELHRLWTTRDDDVACVEHEPTVRRSLAATRARAEELLAHLGGLASIECYEAHGDFTRWNALLSSSGQPLVLDWEEYGVQPRFFDVIHYYVSADVLLSRRSPTRILARLTRLGARMVARGLATQAQWRQYVGLYFVGQSLRQCAAYERQSALHAQVEWQLCAWRACMQQLLMESRTPMTIDMPVCRVGV